MPIEVLGPVHHRCAMCGGSCQGAFVALSGDEEESRVRALAEGLGIPDPVVDGRLRQEGGACVFLDDARRCRIHETAGLEAKPMVCRQFPILAARTETTTRVGVDPACYHAMETWGSETAPASGGPLVATKSPLPPQQVHFEQVFLDETEDVHRLREALALLSDADFPARWHAHLAAFPLDACLLYTSDAADE